ncbi:RagB/SusD family nutrient uptake outer membrane protein [Flavobacterium psychrotrophum]|uniref:RagB/SusD family nutrient uptake outer membrane protein n=1 Tax=Flavobacterium psychrotrophum TaxID=2294119 RepID=UPI000E31B433|nr:RagB/SusD family nutrient uptake outer membrane protein [Flavobacterium psychrotrophum]
MKKRILLFGLIAMAFTTGCSDDFLDVKPLDRYSDAAVWSDQALVKNYVNGIYEGMHYGFNAEMFASISDEAMDVWGWETQAVINGDISNSYLGVFTHFSGSYNRLSWWSLYKNVRNCNVFLKNIDLYGLSGAEVERMKGEVYFLRGYYYYWLMSLYGGVPVIDTAYQPTDDMLIQRNTLEETVNFIVENLDQAAALLPESGDKARASKGAAMALKSRVLLYAASDLFNSQASWASGYSKPELLSYMGGDRTVRWQAAKDAAKAVIDMNGYSLHGGTAQAPGEQAINNYVSIFLNHGTNEDIFYSYYDNVNDNGWASPSPGLFNGPNGYHGWGGNTPTQQFIDSYEMADGSSFSWANPAQAAAPYQNRDPRFYANTLYDGAHWRQRPDDIIASDPAGIVQTGYYENADGTYRAGLDTRQGPIEDWNGSYTGYYIRKFIDPAINHQYERQKYPWRQIRYAEVLLNYAEACIELGQYDEARTYLNMIRGRAGMPAIAASVTGADLKARYRNERKIELAWEQHRYFDIRRWMIAPEVIKNVGGIDIRHPFNGGPTRYNVIDVQNRKWNANNKTYFMPILLDEINRNSLLVQNPGY